LPEPSDDFAQGGTTKVGGAKVSIAGFFAVGSGAAVGAWLRWGLGIVLNPVFPTLPLGTLAANIIGGYLVGIALGVLTHFEALPPEIRLLLTTGFLGGLTTFSTFSAEATTLLAREQLGWAAAHVAVHVVGSVLMTFAGIATMRFLLR
jgi:CrcB protein